MVHLCSDLTGTPIDFSKTFRYQISQSSNDSDPFKKKKIQSISWISLWSTFACVDLAPFDCSPVRSRWMLHVLHALIEGGYSTRAYHIRVCQLSHGGHAPIVLFCSGRFAPRGGDQVALARFWFSAVCFSFFIEFVLKFQIPFPFITRRHRHDLTSIVVFL